MAAGGYSTAAPIAAAPVGNPRRELGLRIRLMERYADACSHPMLQSAHDRSIRVRPAGVHQLIRLRALLGALRSCR